MSENFNPYQSPDSDLSSNGERPTEIVGDDRDNRFIVIARCFTPTEAHLLKGALSAGGVNASVVDDNFVQADSWLTTAVGGVRVLVPASQREEARHIMASLDKGDFQLEGEDASPRPLRFVDLKSPVYSPEGAAVWSLLLTPMFGASLHLANARALKDSRLRRIAWLWMIALTAITGAGLYWIMDVSPGASAPFRASLVLSCVTLVWYFMAGQTQSRYLLDVHGPKYPRRGLFIPAMTVGVMWAALAWVISEFL